jgi:CyaY protein
MHKEEAKALFITLQDHFDEKGFENSDLNGYELVIHTFLGVYQFNYHGVTDQVWLSSPVSGAHHFIFDSDLWRSTRYAETLQQILEKEIL